MNWVSISITDTIKLRPPIFVTLHQHPTFDQDQFTCALGECDDVLLTMEKDDDDDDV